MKNGVAAALVGLVLISSCASTSSTKTSFPATKAFTRFSKIVPKRDVPFESTFLNPTLDTFSEGTHIRERVRHTSLMLEMLNIALTIYQNTWSRVDGDSCNFAPTCSAFGVQAISRFGPYGLILTFGRLQKDHTDYRFYSRRGNHLHDPLIHYVFWLRTPKRDDFSSYSQADFAWFQLMRLVNE